MSSDPQPGEYRLDEIDRRIIYELMADARKTSAPMIAEAVNVSGATIRNRITQLETHGIIAGYHASIDFELVDNRLTNLYLCRVRFGELERVTHQAGSIPGIINVREMMGGRLNLHVLAVGENTADLRRIGRALSDMGAEIEDEMLVQNERFFPYVQFGPVPDAGRQPLADYISLAGGAEVVELTVSDDAPIAGLTLERAVRDELLDDDTLVIAIEREDAIITPHGDTEIRADDIVTIFSRSGTDNDALSSFSDPGDGNLAEST